MSNVIWIVGLVIVVIVKFGLLFFLCLCFFLEFHNTVLYVFFVGRCTFFGANFVQYSVWWPSVGGCFLSLNLSTVKIRIKIVA